MITTPTKIEQHKRNSIIINTITILTFIILKYEPTKFKWLINRV